MDHGGLRKVDELRSIYWTIVRIRDALRDLLPFIQFKET